jgi:7-cyano-7-deazaguanine synthase
MKVMGVMNKKNASKAVVLLSGGLDSATVLFYVRSKGYDAHCLIFTYGQRHSRETKQAIAIASSSGSTYDVLNITLPWKGSSLLDKKAVIPHNAIIDPKEIPSTYVPGRNTVFLSFALSCAEAIGARKIFIGANAVDYSGYPDCRPEYFAVFSKMAGLGTKAGIKGRPIKIEAPLLHKSKADIVKLGLKLGVPFEMTWSCYKGGKRPCGKCDSCILRSKGFNQAGIKDPSL